MSGSVPAPSAERFDQVVLILADGTRPDVFAELLQRGELPGIAALLRGTANAAGELRPALACSVFPSTTGPAHLPFVTGRYPGPCNVPGIRWLDPARYGGSLLSPFRFRSYMGLGNFLAASDLERGIPTLFEQERDHACICGNVRRGVRFARDLTRWDKLVHNVRSFFAEEWYGLDELAGQRMCQAVRRGTRFVFASFYSADSNGHKHGPHHPRTLGAYGVIDRAVGELGSLLRSSGKLERTLVLLVSDHGLSGTEAHLDLQRLVDEAAGPCLAHPTIWHGLWTARSAVMVSGNSMAHVYLRGRGGWGDPWLLEPSGPRARRQLPLLELLLQQDAVDQVAGRTGDGAVLVLSRSGSALIRRAGAGEVEYRPGPEGDPFGYAPEAAGVHEDRALLSLTWDSDYPDAPAQLLQVFDSPRCGHLVVTARPGHDLRARFEKPAHRGSHGSLHRVHMMTPLMASHPLPAGPHRTVDVHPTITAALGLAPAAQADGLPLLAADSPAGASG